MGFLPGMFVVSRCHAVTGFDSSTKIFIKCCENNDKFCCCRNKNFATSRLILSCFRRLEVMTWCLKILMRT